MKDDNNILAFKNKGNFFTTKLTQDGKPLENGKLYPFDSLIHKIFFTKKQCIDFAKSIGCRYEFD